MTDTEDVQEFVDETISENDIVIFMKGSKEEPKCGYSEKALILTATNTQSPIATVDVLGDHIEEYRDALESHSNRSTIPQVFVEEEFIGGSDILEQLHERGELQEKLDVSDSEE